MSAEVCDKCGVARSPAIEHVDDGERYVLCYLCDSALSQEER